MKIEEGIKKEKVYLHIIIIYTTLVINTNGN